MIANLHAELARGAKTSVQVIEETLERAKLYSHLNAFASLDPQGALSAAQESDRWWQRSRARPLEGVPVSVKDFLNLRGRPAQGGSLAPMPHLEVSEALAVTRLREAGAVIFGTTNMHEIGLGLTGENPSVGDVCNPFDPRRQAGGSSSGSGAAVGADIGLASIGTDTGGSVRVPSSHCGAVSYKPTFGVVPLTGVVPLASTCDHLGSIANCVSDAKLIVEVMAATSFPVRPALLTPTPRLGVPWDFLDGRLSPAVRAEFQAFLGRVQQEAAGVISVAPENLERTLDTYTTICWSEAAMTHHAAIAAGALERFSDRVQACLKVGTATSAVDYLRAQESRRLILKSLSRMFASDDVEAILLPASPVPAPVRGTSTVDLESGPRHQRDALLPLVAPFSLCGLPVVTLPFCNIAGLPVAVQIVGPTGSDARVLEIALWLESGAFRDWKKPPAAPVESAD